MRSSKFSWILLVAAACSSPQSENTNTASTATYVFTSDPAADIKKMQWLIGTWKGMYKGKPFYEAWHQLNDSVIMNYEIKITDADTVIKNSGTIHVRGENFFYGTDSVYWKLLSMTPDELVFKNDTLPYSRTILWKHTTDDHWYTKLSHPNTADAEYDLIKQPAIDEFVIKEIKKDSNK